MPPTTALARAFAARSKLFLSGTQLAFFPEIKEADKFVSSGLSPSYVSRCVPFAKRDELHRGLKRVVDVCKQLPGGSSSDLSQAALFRTVAMSESSQGLAATRSAIDALETFHSPFNIDGANNILDNTLGTERAAIAEAFLAAARAKVIYANGTGKDIQTADNSLQCSIKAASNIEDLQYLASEGGFIDDSSREQLVQSLSALLPNALALARAHSLSVIVSKLRGKSADSATKPKNIQSEVESSSAGSGAVSLGQSSEKTPSPSLQQLHLQVVFNACDVADLVITGTVNGRTTELFNATVQDTRFVLSRTALVRAMARRNYASVLLLEASEAFTGELILIQSSGKIEKEAETQRDAAKSEYGAQGLAMSLTTQAQAQITTALELVDNALVRLKDLNLSLSGNDLQTTSHEINKNSWTNLAIDLRLMRAELTSAAAELGLITALFSIWQQPTKDAKTAVLFPLTDELADAVGPVLKTVSAAAESALKQSEEVEALLKSGATAADHGQFLGVSQPLATIALLQFVAGKAVTGEGLFRAAIDRFSETSRELLPVAVTSTASSGIEGDVALWQSRLSVTQQAQAASTLHVYGALLKQWEKRESEAKKVTSFSESLFSSASKPLGMTFPKNAFFGGNDARRDFLSARIFASALTLLHAGSSSGMYLLDWGKI